VPAIGVWITAQVEASVQPLLRRALLRCPSAPRGLACTCAALLSLVTLRARADEIPAWPVRINASMPLGDTWGREQMHGFTWGFRGSLLVYPTDSGRGVGAGGYGEMLLDAQTHGMSSLGATLTAPVLSWDILDVRLGGAVGARWSDADDERRLATALISELVIPAYVYDFRLGVRLDGTFDGSGMSATSLLFEVDVIAVLGAIAAAAGSSKL
jgi:hypothetical protein